MMSIRRSSPHSATRQRGAALVEFSLILVPLVLILVGTVELGLAWRDTLTLDQASRSGARVAASLANNPASDREALRALVSVLGPQDLDQIEYVVLYEVGSDGAMPSGCDAASSAQCNRYPQAALADLDNDMRWECSASSHDGNWCPTDREPELTSPVDMGVRIESRRPWVTGMLPGDGITIGSTTIMRLNPLHR